jgi:hypothetical protein
VYHRRGGCRRGGGCRRPYPGQCPYRCSALKMRGRTCIGCFCACAYSIAAQGVDITVFVCSLWHSDRCLCVLSAIAKATHKQAKAMPSLARNRGAYLRLVTTPRQDGITALLTYGDLSPCPYESPRVCFKIPCCRCGEVCWRRAGSILVQTCWLFRPTRGPAARGGRWRKWPSGWTRRC